MQDGISSCITAGEITTDLFCCHVAQNTLKRSKGTVLAQPVPEAVGSRQGPMVKLSFTIICPVKAIGWQSSMASSLLTPFTTAKYQINKPAKYQIKKFAAVL